MDKLYVDGGVIGSQPSTIGGTWAAVWVQNDGYTCKYGSIPLTTFIGHTTVSSNIMEIVAIYKGLSLLPDGWTGTVFSDSEISLGRVFGSYAWNGVPWWLKKKVLDEKSRMSPGIMWQHVAGHPSKKELALGMNKKGQLVSEYNVMCDDLCKKAAEEYQFSRISKK